MVSYLAVPLDDMEAGARIEVDGRRKILWTAG